MTRVLSVLTFALCAVGACDGGPDTAENLRKALDEANIRAVQVDVDEDANVVYLQGAVGTLADRTRANEIATAVVGTSGRVLNEITVAALTDRHPDDVDGRLTDKLDVMIDADPVLRERDVNIQVVNGTVTVTGEVRTSREKARVERIVSSTPDVKEVVNHLQVRAEP